MGVNTLPKIVTRQRGGRGSNSQPLSHESDALATRLSTHAIVDELKFHRSNFLVEFSYHPREDVGRVREDVRRMLRGNCFRAT